MVEDFESVLRRTFRNDTASRNIVGGELEANWRVSDSLAVLPSLTVLHWLHSDDPSRSNVGVPEQNSKFLGGLRLQGLFGKERWGYGVGATIGVGYDVPVSATLSVTPVLNFNYGSLGDLTADGVKTADGASFNVIQLGLGVTIH